LSLKRQFKIAHHIQLFVSTISRLNIVLSVSSRTMFISYIYSLYLLVHSAVREFTPIDVPLFTN
ncbi:MAG: hypothetical protein JW995_00745, partial [Melioribacteraceae bacterium]|nr:hypothetical protein [Melioribacteraceae bacterium]